MVIATDQVHIVYARTPHRYMLLNKDCLYVYIDSIVVHAYMVYACRFGVRIKDIVLFIYTSHSARAKMIQGVVAMTNRADQGVYGGNTLLPQLYILRPSSNL